MTPATDLDEAPTDQAPSSGRALTSGAWLRDYEITAVIGARASSIVYLAWDHALQRKVALKEYMPSEMASRIAGSAAVAVASQRHAGIFRAGLKGFVEEARLLARFDHPSLVKVYRFWAENETAYMAMPFLEGPTLKAALAELGHVPGEAELRAWLQPILNAVTVLHEEHTWHLNIGPDDIVLTPFGPVLLGFGTASRAIAAAEGTPDSGLKPGYAAIELYGSEATTSRGPWSDLYALAAVVYEAIAGEPPPPAPTRLVNDTLQPLGQVAAGLYRAGFLAAIDAALAVRPDRRPRDHGQFRALMGDIDEPAPVSLAPRRDLMQEPFLGDDDGAPEVTVPDRPVLLLAAEPPVAPPPPGTPLRMTTAPVLPPVSRATPTNAEAAPWMAAVDGRRRSRRTEGVVLAAVAVTAAALVLAAQLQIEPRAPTGRAPVPVPTPVASLPPPAAVMAPVMGPIAGPIAAPVTAPITAPVSAAASTFVPTSAPAPLSPSIAASVAGSGVATSTAAERQVRCIGILQKASLEQISAAKTDFFKSACK